MSFLAWNPSFALFLLSQKCLYAAFRATTGLPHSVSGGIFNLVAVAVICLLLLGSLPELAAQALRSIIQPTANKLLRCGLDFLF